MSFRFTSHTRNTSDPRADSLCLAFSLGIYHFEPIKYSNKDILYSVPSYLLRIQEVSHCQHTICGGFLDLLGLLGIIDGSILWEGALLGDKKFTFRLVESIYKYWL